MANLFEPTPAQIAEWNDWLSTRPPSIRAIGEKLFPWKLYQIGPDGHRVTLRSFEEHKDPDPVTASVVVHAEFNSLVLGDYGVFGVDPTLLIECDIPSPDEIIRIELLPARRLPS